MAPMGDATVFDAILALALLAAAGFALFGRPRMHAAAMFLVFGVLLSVIWARLDAPDVAIAEAVLGAGVTGALLIHAVTTGPRADDDQSGPDELRGNPDGRRRSGGVSRVLASRGVLGAVCAALSAGLLAAVWRWADPDGIGELVTAEGESAGVKHPVTAVLLNFRSYDTLLEVAVLAAAAIGALALMPAQASGEEGRAVDRGPLGALTRVLVPVLVLVTGWLLVAGSTRPGGAFHAGAVLAGALLLLHLAGFRVPAALRWLARPALFVGLAAFLALAGATFALGNGWLTLEPKWAGGVILGLEAVLTLSIGTTLALLLVAMRRIDAAPAREPAGGER